MPTYNYKCRDCEHKFSIEAKISEKSDGLDLSCPECEGRDIFQTFNKIGIIGGNSSESCSSSSCGGCSGC